MNIKNKIVKYMKIVTVIMMIVMIGIAVLLQVLNVQRHARERANIMFRQIEQLLVENQEELAEVKDEYSQTCLHSAEAIAYIIESQPSVLEDVDELKKIADFMEVDEIHIFDETGEIITGTHPEYYGFTMNSGEQIGFFKPMLEDKSLKLCQDITPNTAEAKSMQYSAVWSENGEFIVQVGMEPVNVLSATEKNELSYMFSLFRVNVGVHIYAIDAKSGKIVGSTVTEDVGKNLTEVGFDLTEIQEEGDGFHTKVNGEGSYCVFTQIGSNLIGRVVTNDVLYQNIIAISAGLAICLILIGVILVWAVTRYMNKYVVGGIYNVNEKLRAISDGNLDEKVDVQSSLEFAELSSHINEMVKTLLASTEKMSYVLNKTNVHIGVYECNENMKNVRFTEYIAKLYGLEINESGQYSCKYKVFKEYMDQLREHPVPNENDTYLIPGDQELYIKIEEITQNSNILGMVIDVTEEVLKRRKIEAERDIDLLTGLYNRRGMEHKLAELFAEPEKLGHSAIIMVDTDELKEINDKYGHEMGDTYLKKVSEVLNSFDSKSHVIARQGGDEFVLFLYHYENEAALLDSIETLRYIQNNTSAYLGSDLIVPLRFSMGVSLVRGETDYQTLIKRADERMYVDKRERKVVER